MFETGVREGDGQVVITYDAEAGTCGEPTTSTTAPTTSTTAAVAPTAVAAAPRFTG